MSGTSGGNGTRNLQPTPAQREIASALDLGAASSAYHEGWVLSLRGPLDEAALERALTALAARHEALRLRFAGTAAQFALVERAEIPLVRGEVTAEREPGRAAQAWLQALIERPFLPTFAPLVRAGLVRLGPEEHQFALVAHHAVCDARSLAQLAAELWGFYGAFKRGMVAELPPAISYAEFAARHAEHDDERARRDLARWTSQFAGGVPSLDLPLDKPRPAVRTYATARVSRSLPGGLLRALRALSEHENVSLEAVTLTAFGSLLARITQQWDLVVGTGVGAESGPLPVGLCTHYLPLRLRLDAEVAFTRALSEVASARTQASEHARCTFGSVLAATSVARDPSRMPLAPVSFAFERAPALEAAELDTEYLSFPRAHGAFELALSVQESARGLRFELEYNRDLFEQATACDWLESLEALLTSACEDAARPLGKLEVLSAAAGQRLLERFNCSEGDYDRDVPVHGFFEAQAQRTPDAIALRFEERALRYAELEILANRLAHVLKKHGVGPESIVGVSVPRSPEMVIAQLAILKAGGAYLPLDPNYPSDRLTHMLSDSGCEVVVSRKDSAAWLAESDRRVVFVDELEQGFASEPSTPPARESGPNNLAYVIYTSGSTGKPKGVLVQHKNFANFMCAMDRMLTLKDGGVWLFATSIAFDISLLEVFGALGRGFQVVLHSGDSGEDHTLAKLIARHGVTHFQCTPSQMRMLVDEPESRRVIPQLRELILGGEAVPSDLAAELLALLPNGRLINGYGPTETTIYSVMHHVTSAQGAIPIGRPVANTRVYVLDPRGELCPRGAIGELFIGGHGVTRGYHARPELTRERFVPDPFVGGEARMYRTGDLVRFRHDGVLEFHGRNDHQVKIRGYRIELGEIEAVLRRSELVRDVVVVPHLVRGESVLAAYVVSEATPAALRAAVRKELPEFMVPAIFMRIAAMPLNPNGKVDRRALPSPREDYAEAEVSAPTSELEAKLASVWCEVLERPRVGVDDSFFDLGGNSVRLVEVAKRLRAQHGIEVSVARLFQHLTVRDLAKHLGGEARATKRDTKRHRPRPSHDEPIAIVGMAGRFPGAPDVRGLWRELLRGSELVKHFTLEELDPSLAELARDPAYVRARPVLEGASNFDAEFFGIAPAEAEVMDPQQRVLLEVAWEALEDAGCDPAQFDGLIGVYCGEYNDTYYTHNVASRPDAVERVGAWVAMTANEKDYVAMRIAHRLDLRGPALSVHTACSTSLVCVAQAFFALRTHQCDMALAGGVAISYPQHQGHLYVEGGMLSADGTCRPFDAEATGTMFGDGAGMLVLKRLSDALADGDHVYAVIKGAAINNDGGHKMSFSAPTVEGQAQVIQLAQELAGVSPDSIGYVEAHGTATPLGDPIEVEALTQAFRAGTARRGYCALGSIKSNLGHLTAAAGVAGVIKAALALENQELPRTLHFRRPNPRIDFAASPFFVLSENRSWPRSESPRRAGVSSFGVGGTNAHVVLEEAPLPLPRPRVTGPELLVLSARGETALGEAGERLAAHLAAHPDLSLADVAFTLACGRRAFAHRRSLVVRDAAEAQAALRKAQASKPAPRNTPELVFVFPGQGSQHAGMGRALYATYPAFRDALDRCAELLAPKLEADLRSLMFAAEGDASAHALLRETRIAQPAIFAMEHALATLWMSFGVRPRAMIGHSVGEFVAAHLAEVMSLEDALDLVAERGRLLQSMPRGAMLSVRAPAAHLAQTLDPSLAIAAVNAPNLCVVAGPDSAVDALSALLEAEGVATTRLHTSHAFHSPMMDPAVPEFAEHVKRVKLAEPRIPIFSTVTGQPMRAEEATSSAYWAGHLRAAVRFADAVQAAFQHPSHLLLEVGPRNTATQLARLCATDRETQVALASLEGRTDQEELASFLRAVGQLFERGVHADLKALFEGRAPRRVSLPTYPFERRPYYLEPGAPPVRASASVPIAESTAPAETLPGSAPSEQLIASQLRLMEMQLEILAKEGILGEG